MHCAQVEVTLQPVLFKLQLALSSFTSAMTAEALKLRREKRELENALTTLKKNSAATQEELAKGNRRLAAELQSVKKDGIRLKEVRTLERLH